MIQVQLPNGQTVNAQYRLGGQLTGRAFVRVNGITVSGTVNRVGSWCSGFRNVFTPTGKNAGLVQNG